MEEHLDDEVGVLQDGGKGSGFEGCRDEGKGMRDEGREMRAEGCGMPDERKGIRVKRM